MPAQSGGDPLADKRRVEGIRLHGATGRWLSSTRQMPFRRQRTPTTGSGARATLRPMPDMLGPGRRILASQPFSVLLDAELLRLGDGRAELRIPVRAELKQQHGFVHGGVISYAADNALTFAGGSALGTERRDRRVQDQLPEARPGRGAGRARRGRPLRTDPGGLPL